MKIFIYYYYILKIYYNFQLFFKCYLNEVIISLDGNILSFLQFYLKKIIYTLKFIRNNLKMIINEKLHS